MRKYNIFDYFQKLVCDIQIQCMYAYKKLKFRQIWASAGKNVIQYEAILSRSFYYKYIYNEQKH